MNAAIRSIVRTGRDKGLEVFGVKRGFNGLLHGEFRPLGSRDVSGIIQEGGTFLGTARCPEFSTPDGTKQALEQLAVALRQGQRDEASEAVAQDVGLWGQVEGREQPGDAVGEVLDGRPGR